MRVRAWSNSHWSGWRNEGRTDGVSARRILFRDGHVSRVRLSERAVVQRPGALESLGMSFWQNRPTLVTGATGLVGSWLVKRLLAAGAEVVCLVRDWVPQCELSAARRWNKSRSCAGTCATRPCWSGPWANTKSTRCFIWRLRRSWGSRTGIRCRRSRRIFKAPGPSWKPAAVRRWSSRSSSLRAIKPTATMKSFRMPKRRLSRGGIPTTSASRART